MAATVLYCWKELDWGGGRTAHAHSDGFVLHGGSWPPPPRMRRFVNESLLYALVAHRSRASTAKQTDQVPRPWRLRALLIMIRRHCGEALILVASFTGGSILM